MTRALVLASSSPRRRALLSEAGYSFTIAEPDVDESALPGEKPEELAARLALAKARAVGARVAARRVRARRGHASSSSTATSSASRATRPKRSRCCCAWPGRTHRVLTGFALFVPGSARDRRTAWSRARCACTPSTARPPSATPRAASRSTRPGPTRRRATAAASSAQISRLARERDRPPGGGARAAARAARRGAAMTPARRAPRRSCGCASPPPRARRGRERRRRHAARRREDAARRAGAGRGGARAARVRREPDPGSRAQDPRRAGALQREARVALDRRPAEQQGAPRGRSSATRSSRWTARTRSTCSSARPPARTAGPRIYLQVNLDAEPQKGGCAPGQVRRPGAAGREEPRTSSWSG